ncbi:MAG: GntR family transcriptional regulator [Pusillimonas sp.]
MQNKKSAKVIEQDKNSPATVAGQETNRQGKVHEDRNSHGKRTATAVTLLRELIVTGGLRPGQRISERSLLEQHADLSRTPLREALKILDSEGLVELRPNRGAFVTRLSMSQIDGAIEVLIGLENIAAMASCQRITGDELDRIEALHEEMLRSFRQKDLLAYFRINQAIHQCIVDGAHNAALSRIYRNEAQQIRRYRYAGNIAAGRWKRAVAEHEQIMDALRRRDGLLLRELLRAHHSKGWEVTRTMLASELEN